MSFFGKKYQKTDIENVLELMDALNVSEKIRAVLRNTESHSTFIKNADGSIQYVVTHNGNTLVDQKIVLGEEADFTTPDGTVTKNTFTLEGDTLKATMKTPDGKLLHFDRHFQGDVLRMEIYLDGLDLKGIVHYHVV
ncbi:hypothetical protein JYU34_011944 [Plutella xylostella]|uniref:Uncharacterized protein n=2 Tax=Plutella xylostella TaxID=51655 RepID=A0ABQ7QE37_PLUXY|nr:fatty acid-binding protein, liver [Plutella xylostella]KAG7303429.1 hypothetical protein JYU34_011944 [Plutella xylostella]CAG9104790.1 unnamed protein product [Plutella xylostella]